MDIIITPAYQEWLDIRNRCYNPNNPSFKDFGAIGAKVCDDWMHSYSNFLRDMGAPPHQGRVFFIERIDSTEPYYKANCRWTPRATANRRLHFQIHPSGTFDLLQPSTSPQAPTTRHPSGTFAPPATPQIMSALELPPSAVHKSTRCTIL
jgi:hypothetical protein